MSMPDKAVIEIMLRVKTFLDLFTSLLDAKRHFRSPNRSIQYRKKGYPYEEMVIESFGSGTKPRGFGAVWWISNIMLDRRRIEDIE